MKISFQTTKDSKEFINFNNQSFPERAGLNKKLIDFRYFNNLNKGDFIKNNKVGIINESADLLYHIFVVWISMGINPQEIWDELSKRQSQSGVEEKKNRGKIHE